MEGALEEVGFMGGERASHDGAEGGGEDGDGVGNGVGAGREKREAMESGVIVDEGDVRRMGEERADGSGVDGGDDQAKYVGGQGFSLLKAVCLAVMGEGGSDLDVSRGGGGVRCEKVEEGKAVERMGGGGGVCGKHKEAGDAGDGGVGVD